MSYNLLFIPFSRSSQDSSAYLLLISQLVTN